MVNQSKDKIFILLAVYQTLHFFIEVLHAHAQAVETFRPQVVEHIQFDFTRVNFNRDFRISVESKMAAQQTHQTADLRFVEIGRRTATPVQLADVTPGKQRRTVDNLLLQRIQILIGFMLLAGNDFIAATEVAKFVAERDMHVERQRALRIARDGLQKFGLAKGFSKLQRGRV